MASLFESKFKRVVNGEIGDITSLLTEYQLLLLTKSKFFAEKSAKGIMSIAGGKSTRLAQYEIEENFENSMDASGKLGELVNITEASDATIERLKNQLDSVKTNPVEYGLYIEWLIYNGLMPAIKDKIDLPESILVNFNRWFDSLKLEMSNIVAHMKEVLKDYPKINDLLMFRYPYTIADFDPGKISNERGKKLWDQLNLQAEIPRDELLDLWNKYLRIDIEKYSKLYAIIKNPNSRWNKRDFAVDILRGTPYFVSLSTFKACSPRIAKNITQLIGSSDNIILANN